MGNKWSYVYLIKASFLVRNSQLLVYGVVQTLDTPVALVMGVVTGDKAWTHR